MESKSRNLVHFIRRWQRTAPHVREAFRREGQILAGIEAGTVTTTAEIDAAFAV